MEFKDYRNKVGKAATVASLVALVLFIKKPKRK